MNKYVRMIRNAIHRHNLSQHGIGVKESENETIVMVDNDRLTPPVSFEIKYIHFHQGQQSPILSITDRNNEDNFACAYPTKDKDSSFLYYLEKCLCEVIEHR